MKLMMTVIAVPEFCDRSAKQLRVNPHTKLEDVFLKMVHYNEKMKKYMNWVNAV